jgi:DNA-binding MarR family transcriptional regulator
VERRVSTQDRRFVTLHVLPVGESTLAQARQRTEQALAKTLATLPAADQDAIRRAMESLHGAFAAETS